MTTDMQKNHVFWLKNVKRRVWGRLEGREFGCDSILNAEFGQISRSPASQLLR